MHRRRLLTGNVLERLSREIKRRMRVAALFSKAAFLLQLVSAFAIEIAEERESGRIYLSMATEREFTPQLLLCRARDVSASILGR